MNAIVRMRQQTADYLHQRTPRERAMIGVAAVAVLLALIWFVLLAPALDGRARLERALPSLRQQAAELQAMSAEAKTLGAADPRTVAPMSRQTVEAALARKGIKAQNVAMIGDFAKVQLQGVSFPALLDWLDEARRTARMSVTEANVTAQSQAGTVDATLTLAQQKGE
ncbi:MAG: type II secretion system protein GspM [Burkholderiaceae bacterium]